jgi:hypothetical protein
MTVYCELDFWPGSVCDIHVGTIRVRSRGKIDRSWWAWWQFEDDCLLLISYEQKQHKNLIITSFPIQSLRILYVIFSFLHHPHACMSLSAHTHSLSIANWRCLTLPNFQESVGNGLTLILTLVTSHSTSHPHRGWAKLALYEYTSLQGSSGVYWFVRDREGERTLLEL